MNTAPLWWPIIALMYFLGSFGKFIVELCEISDSRLQDQRHELVKIGKDD